MNKKRALLVDTNFSARPIYDYLINAGLEVYVIGANPNDSLAKTVNNYIELNYAKINELEDVIKKLKIDLLVPGGNDFSYKICAEIASKKNFYNIDTPYQYEVINNKEKFRKFSLELGLHVPQKLQVDNVADSLPVIIKPADAYSGHGITVLHTYTKEKLELSINKAKKYSKTDSFLIEEFIEGQLYSHSAFVVNGELMIDFIVEEHCTVNPYVVNTSRVINNFENSILESIRSDIMRLSKALDLPDGLIHTQFIMNENDFWLIEVTRRCPGDLYSKLIEYSTGFPYAEFYARPFINQVEEYKLNNLNASKVIRHTITSEEPIDFHSLTYYDAFDKQIFYPLSLTGDKLRESPFSRIALLFGFSNDIEQHNRLWKKFLTHNFYQIN